MVIDARLRDHIGATEQRGFTYLGLLLAIALIGIGLTAASEVWVTTANREKTVALEWAGAQFVNAIGSYYESTPGATKTYPATLEELLEDRRYLTARRHLRAIYVNPFTNSIDWIPVKGADGRLRGVQTTAIAELGVAGGTFIHLPATGTN